MNGNESFMPLFLAILVSFIVGNIVYAFIKGGFKRSTIRLEDRLNSADSKMYGENGNDKNRFDRTYRRFYKRFIVNQFRDKDKLQNVSKLLGTDIERLAYKIAELNLSKTITVEEIIALKVFGLLGLSLSIIFSLITNNYVFIGLGFVLFFLLFVLPSKKIDDKAKLRKETIENDMPDFLDLVSSVTEAGLSIQDALQKVSVKYDSPLAEVFKSVYIETQANGGRWGKAMESASYKNDIPALSDLISDILISFEKGTSISKTLKDDSKQLRVIKSNKIQAKARSMSSKLILPMAVFIFLPMMTMILAPALIQLSKSLM